MEPAETRGSELLQDELLSDGTTIGQNEKYYGFGGHAVHIIEYHKTSN
jgi:hypothetical protein